MRYLLVFIFASVLNAQLLTEIDNQILHLKGTTGVTVTGAGVSTWADQSGNAHDFSQTTDADRPDYVNNAYLDFDRSNTEYLLRSDDDDFSFGDASSDEPWSISVYINMDDATRFDIISKGEFDEARFDLSRFGL